jgi:hypothetical protein
MMYISASRRTDIPAFFADEFFASWKTGSIAYDGGYGRSYTVSLKPEDVTGYVFWSKDYSRFITHPCFRELIGRNNAVFHFTINDCPALEPRIPPLDKRIETLRALCDLVGPQRVFWRFDPICRYTGSDGIMTGNERPFFRLLPVIAGCGIKRCYFSFMTGYNKLRHRGIHFGEFTTGEKIAICKKMSGAARSAGVELYNCCNEEIFAFPGIRQAHCVDESILNATDRFGVHRQLAPKPTRKGCGCFESRDIGSYSQKCAHGCRYCYANPLA